MRARLAGGGRGAGAVGRGIDESGAQRHRGIPLGFGHDREGAALSTARERPGANGNILADETALDPLSGNAVLNGIPVTVRAA